MFETLKAPWSNEEWMKMWDIIATKMIGLRYLIVHLKRTCKPLLVLGPDEKWVKSMLRLRSLRQFRFELSESQSMPERTEGYEDPVQWFKEYVQTARST